MASLAPAGARISMPDTAATRGTAAAGGDDGTGGGLLARGPHAAMPIALTGAAGAFGMGAYMARGTQAAPWLRNVAIGVGVLAVLGGLWYLSAGQPKNYSVQLSSAPDYEAAGADTPSEVYKVANAHFDAHDDAIRAALEQMKAEGIVRGYEAFPINNNFVVEVNGRRQGEFRERLGALPDVGTIEQAM